MGGRVSPLQSETVTYVAGRTSKIHLSLLSEGGSFGGAQGSGYVAPDRESAGVGGMTVEESCRGTRNSTGRASARSFSPSGTCRDRPPPARSPEERRRHARTRHPDGPRCAHPTGHVVGAATANRCALFGSQLRPGLDGERTMPSAARRSTSGWAQDACVASPSMGFASASPRLQHSASSGSGSVSERRVDHFRETGSRRFGIK